MNLISISHNGFLVTKIKIIFAVIFIVITAQSFAQETDKEQAISIQEVTVVKSYSPSLSRASRIPTRPTIEDSLNNQKRNVDYQTISVPVVSTFSPNKATALKLQQKKKPSPFNTLLSLGAGNQQQLFLDFSTSLAVSKSQSIGAFIYRDGYGANVENTLLNSDANYLLTGISHLLTEKRFYSNSQLLFESSKNNYYGLYPATWDTALLESINPKIQRNYFKANTNWQWYDKTLQDLDFLAHITSDNFESSEAEFYLATTLSAKLGKSKLDLKIDAHVLNTRFDSATPLESDFTIAGATLQWVNIKNKLKYRLGMRTVYYVDDPDGKNLYYYPALDISYHAKKKQIIPYLKAFGNLKLNTYRNLSKQNPFVAPALLLTPTQYQYNAQLGFRTGMASALTFDFNIGYDKIDNYPIFKKNPYVQTENAAAYQWGNSFQAHYQNLDVFSGTVRLTMNLGNNNQLAFTAKYASYTAENDATLWNLPPLSAGFEGNFRLTNAIAIHLNTKLIGERDGFSQQVIVGNSSIPEPSSESLPMFLQSNFQINGKLSPSWDLFFKGNFNSGDIHGQWGYFPQNQWLLLGGITYKFDLKL